MKITVDEINGVIHRRNLYIVNGCLTRRVISCHIYDSQVCVIDLYTKQRYPLQGNRFMDGYGQEVVI